MTDAPGPPPPRELRVRPYMLTGGRTRAQSDLPLETLIKPSARGTSMLPRLRLERRDIIALCSRDTISIAEVSAHLHLPLGVARVLVGDLADDGLIETRSQQLIDDRPDARLLERVLDGLQAL